MNKFQCSVNICEFVKELYNDDYDWQSSLAKTTWITSIKLIQSSSSPSKKYLAS